MEKGQAIPYLSLTRNLLRVTVFLRHLEKARDNLTISLFVEHILNQRTARTAARARVTTFGDFRDSVQRACRNGLPDGLFRDAETDANVWLCALPFNERGLPIIVDGIL